jgi:hypothetical protein
VELSEIATEGSKEKESAGKKISEEEGVEYQEDKYFGNVRLTKVTFTKHLSAFDRHKRLHFHILTTKNTG